MERRVVGRKDRKRTRSRAERDRAKPRRHDDPAIFPPLTSAHQEPGQTPTKARPLSHEQNPDSSRASSVAIPPPSPRSSGEPVMPTSTIDMSSQSRAHTPPVAPQKFPRDVGDLLFPEPAYDPSAPFPNVFNFQQGPMPPFVGVRLCAAHKDSEVLGLL